MPRRRRSGPTSERDWPGERAAAAVAAGAVGAGTPAAAATRPPADSAELRLCFRSRARVATCLCCGVLQASITPMISEKPGHCTTRDWGVQLARGLDKLVEVGLELLQLLAVARPVAAL